MHWRSMRPERVTTGTIRFSHFGQRVVRSMRASRFSTPNQELELLFHLIRPKQEEPPTAKPRIRSVPKRRPALLAVCARPVAKIVSRKTVVKQPRELQRQPRTPLRSDREHRAGFERGIARKAAPIRRALSHFLA